MKILIITKDLYPQIGGPYNVITTTVNQLIRHTDLNIKLIAKNDSYKEDKVSWINTIKRYNIIHYYGGWDLFYVKIALISFAFRKNFICTPMGIFEPWSLNQKKIKKIFALFFYQKKFLDKSNIIHATSETEKKNIQKITKNNNIITIPHGIDPLFNSCEKLFFQNGVKKALFFSRIHKKKGIDDLVDVWKRIEKKNWELHIYGPDNDKIVKNLKKNLDLNSKIFFHEPIFSEKKKQEVFNESDLFILPTKSENFGYVILESLRAGLPVLTTNKTPWNNILESNAGWIIDDNILSLEKSLEKILLLDKKEFETKSKNAIKLCKKYLWSTVLPSYVSLYKNLK
ncbi:glycosyltransferase [Candidatus Pelagibacter sp.]|nr:glycosyltransferase [Candidatus Pelagibacter sp.]